MSEHHYLQGELYQLIQTNPQIFKFLEEGSLDGIWFWDMQNPENEWYSERFKALLGFAEGEVPNTSDWWQQHIFEQDLALALSNFDNHLNDSSFPYDQIVRYRHKTGTTVWVRCRGLIIRDDQGQPWRMLGAHTDVSEQKITEEKLRLANDELHRSNQELEQFAYMASHDLQEPLRKINRYLDLLATQLGPEVMQGDAQLFMDRVQGASQRMGCLIWDLLTLSKVQTTPVLHDRVDLTRVVAEVLSMLEVMIKESEAVVNYSDDLPTVLGDAGQLQLVFQNLLSNAIKFRRPNVAPLIQVSAEYIEDKVYLHVADNGMGFEPDQIATVFHPFKRVHRKIPGSGIGLTISQRVMAKHGGSISAQSVPGQGSTFSLYLPLG